MEMKSCLGVTGTGGGNGEVVLGFDSPPGEARDSKAGEPGKLRESVASMNTLGKTG